MAISVAVAVGPQSFGDALVRRLAARVAALHIGPGDADGVKMRPLVTREHLAKVRAYVDAGVAEGARLVVDGRDYRSGASAEGFFVGGCEFGNGCAIFTCDGGAARQFVHDVQCGMVGVNVPIPVPLAFHNFGGWKRSLFGDHAMHGP